VLGDQLILSGQQMFVKSALPRLIGGLSYVAAGPITSGLATTPTITGTTTVEVSGGIGAGITVPGAGVVGDLLCYMSEPTPLSRTVSHAKKAFAGITGPPVAGVFTVAIAGGDLPYDLVEGLQVRLYWVYLDDDGRVSTQVKEDIVIAA
jgi:hypothetical protein